MNFIVRPARLNDLEDIYHLAKQFVLLNLPADKRSIERKIELSGKSFGGTIDKESARYLFVIEDLDTNSLVGSAQVVAKKGTVDNPNYSFKIIKKERFSPDLSVGFIHQILRLKIDEDGNTEVGGLIVDKSYRRRPEKVGKILSLARFIYIALHREDFRDKVFSEMAPPLTEDGRSEFWEALGRRFTGMPYKEADSLSWENKDFIRSLFPEEDIYVCLLDSKARLVMGRVSIETQPALRLLKKVGFVNNDEVDPFDGGPHLEVHTDEIQIIKDGYRGKIKLGLSATFSQRGLVGVGKNKEFKCGMTSYLIENGDVVIPESTLYALGCKEEEMAFVVAID